MIHADADPDHLKSHDVGGRAEAVGTEKAHELVIEGGSGWPLEFRPAEGTVLFRNAMVEPDRDMILFDYVNRREIRRYSKRASLGHNTLSPDGRWLAGDGDMERIYLLNTRNEVMIRADKTHDDEVVGLAWLPDSRRLVSWGRDTRVCLWDVVAGQKKPALVGTYENINWIFARSCHRRMVPAPLPPRAGTSSSWTPPSDNRCS